MDGRMLFDLDINLFVVVATIPFFAHWLVFHVARSEKLNYCPLRRFNTNNDPIFSLTIQNKQTNKCTDRPAWKYTRHSAQILFISFAKLVLIALRYWQCRPYCPAEHTIAYVLSTKLLSLAHAVNIYGLVPIARPPFESTKTGIDRDPRTRIGHFFTFVGLTILFR